MDQFECQVTLMLRVQVVQEEQSLGPAPRFDFRGRVEERGFIIC